MAKLAALSLFVILAIRAHSVEPGIRWHTDLDEANRIAASAGSPLLIVFR